MKLLKRSLFHLVIIFALLAASTARSGDPAPAMPVVSFEAAFQAGVTAYQKQDYAAAETAFSQALLKRPDEPSTLTNLGLTQSKLGHKGWALGYFRRALALSPGFHEAKSAMDFLQKEGALREIPHQLETWESLRSSVLVGVSLAALLLLTLLLFIAMGWVWLKFWGDRKRALRSESALPGFPGLAIAFSTLFVLTFALTLAKCKDSLDSRGTVVVENVQALSSPNEKSPSLFELFEGLEVLVHKVEGNWMQVTYPGAMTGWIPKTSLMLTQPGAQ